MHAPPYIFWASLTPFSPKDAVASPAHLAAAVEASAQGLVLLKNDGGTLPLAKTKTTAAIGPLASVQATLIGPPPPWGSDFSTVPSMPR
jgi:beta-glucosidase-like glycosyl hydrolase